MKISNYSKTKIVKNEIMVEENTLEELMNLISGNITRKNLAEDSTVMACISVISSYIASMSCQLFEYSDKDTIKVDNDLTSVLERPNKIQSNFEFTKSMIQEMLINKDSFAKINFKGGKVISIEPIENGILSETLVGSNVWQVEGNIRGQYVKVPYENCIHFRDLFDRYLALKPILESKIIANELVKKSFSSGLNNNIKAWIELEGIASKDKKIAIKKAFNAVLKSEDDNVAVLDDGMKLNPINGGGTHSFQESQVSQIVDMLDKKIHQVLNVPLVMTSIAEGSYNISENLKSSFVESLLPYIKMIEKEYSYKIIPSKDKHKYYFRINYKSLMRANDKDRMQYYKDAVQTGLMTRAEARQIEDLKFIEGTDELDMSLNYVPISKYDIYLEKRYNSNINDKNVG